MQRFQCCASIGRVRDCFMRIVYYYRHLDAPVGSGAHATSLVREWRKAGNEVGCLPKQPGAVSRLDRPTSSTSRLLSAAPADVRHRLRFLQDSLRSVREAPRLLNDVRSWRPDVFIARRNHFDRTLDGLLDGVGCPIVAEVNAVHHSEWLLMLGEILPASAVEREMAFLRRVDFSICVSAEIRQELLTLGVDPARCAVVPNCSTASSSTRSKRRRSSSSTGATTTTACGPTARSVGGRRHRR